MNTEIIIMTQPTIACARLTKETQGVKYVQSYL